MILCGWFSPYEKFKDGTTKPIDIPYDLPAGWEWSRINSIYWNDGQIKPKNDFYYLDTSAVNNKYSQLDSKNIFKIKSTEAPSRARKIVRNKSIIFSTVRPYLKNIAIVDVDNPNEYIASTAFAVLNSQMDTHFLKYYLLYSYFLKQVEEKCTGTNYPAINEKNFNSLFISVPPLNEQLRIANRINDLFDLVDRIEREQEELQVLSKQLKQKVLDVAMQGKLVPQDPTDEPASVLLEKIRAEKQKLFEAGKIKKKDLVNVPVSKEDSAPYRNIPESWEVVSFKDVVRTISTKPYQIKQQEISEVGAHKVISQSQNEYEGYSNQIEKLYTPTETVILFGDHTKTVKRISEPFIIGADGVKLIKPILLEADYLYFSIIYTLKFIKDRGYARHYSYLEKFKIALPGIKEQIKISATLSQVSQVIDLFR